MSTASNHSRMTREEYLAFERASETKHQFFQGEVFATAGASRTHNRITLNLASALLRQLESSRCEPYANDMRVRVNATGLYTYPDVVVACDEPQFEDAEVDTLLTPTVIIEVLSDSTKDYDGGGKWKHYRQIDSLRHYLLVSQDSMEVEMYIRNDDDTWTLSDHTPPDAIVIESIGCRLNWEDIYARVEFEGTASKPTDA